VVRRSLREKKASRYARNRRNDYGENGNSSRKNIRRSKQRDRPTNRRRENQILGDVAGGPRKAPLTSTASTR
jgi:hypothetical protein